MTTEVLDRPLPGHSHEGHDECRRHVEIIVDNVKVTLNAGRYDLDTLKRLSKVPTCDDLDQLIGTKLVAVPADRPVVIEGCEIFASHPHSGGAA